jgi:hypothetical protein
MCGAVRLEVSAPLLRALYCHCKRCQRRSGSAFSVNGLTQPGTLRITAGGENVREYRPEGGGWIKAFCTACGSQLYAANPDDPETKSVRLGVLDQDPGVRPSAHQFVDYAAPWLPLPDDGLPRFPERAA